MIAAGRRRAAARSRSSQASALEPVTATEVPNASGHQEPLAVLSAAPASTPASPIA
ncbi:hypothetical protein RBXJA2T_17222 [Rubrivivax benzoatilyticus JA2 = ATCC BAA-35]|nr:hypothetical protein RBXJA2T_17222 [Rubrivivax benzoatilyticus JA2 = ATCC BAA-35]